MHLRPMRYEDIPQVTDVAIASFRADSSYNWVSPRSNDPNLQISSRRMFVYRLRTRLCNPATHGVVCVEPSTTDPSVEAILGYSWWTRVGPSTSPTQQAYSFDVAGFTDWFEHRVHIPLLEFWEYWIAPNPTTDYTRLHRWRSEISAQDWAKPIPAHWECLVLGVDPAHQRKGAGSMLLDWGIHKATQENVPVTLDATVMGRPLYAKRSFKVLDWLKLSVEVGRSDGWCMAYDPTGRWIRDLRPGEQDWVMYGGHKKQIDATWTDEALAVAKAKEDGVFPL